MTSTPATKAIVLKNEVTVRSMPSTPEEILDVRWNKICVWPTKPETQVMRENFSRFRVYDCGSTFFSPDFGTAFGACLTDSNTSAWNAVHGAIRFALLAEKRLENLEKKDLPLPCEWSSPLPDLVNFWFCSGVLTPQNLKNLSPRQRDEKAWTSDLAIMAEHLDVRIIVFEICPIPGKEEFLYQTNYGQTTSVSSISLLHYAGYYFVFPTKMQAIGAKIAAHLPIDLAALTPV